MWSARARRQRRVAAFLEPLDQLVNPPAGDSMIAGQLSWAAPFKDNGVDDIATECGHAPPPSLVARTMSCDIRELCGELRHFRPCHSSAPATSSQVLAGMAPFPHQRERAGNRGTRCGVSKQLTTRWYISAWIVSAIAWLALLATTHNHQDGTSPAFYLVLAAGAMLMFVCWIGALFRLAQLNSWGWFVAVLFLQLIGLGIVGMVAYALAGPEDSTTVVTRPPLATGAVIRSFFATA